MKMISALILLIGLTTSVEASDEDINFSGPIATCWGGTADSDFMELHIFVQGTSEKNASIIAPRNPRWVDKDSPRVFMWDSINAEIDLEKNEVQFTGYMDYFNGRNKLSFKLNLAETLRQKITLLESEFSCRVHQAGAE